MRLCGILAEQRWRAYLGLALVEPVRPLVDLLVRLPDFLHRRFLGLRYEINKEKAVDSWNNLGTGFDPGHYLHGLLEVDLDEFFISN